MDDEQAAFLGAVDAALHGAVAEGISDRLTVIDQGLIPFAELALSAATVGGKRLRPRFAYWAWRSAAGDTEPTVQIVSLGAALELLHAAILVHDDIIDRSVLRRGRPSVRAGLAAGHRATGWTGSADDFGDHTALLIGDLLWGVAHDLFDTAVDGLDPGQRRLIFGAFRGMRAEVISGQLLELRAQAAGDFSTSAAEKILQYKTSVYTVERPMELGLRVGGATRSTVLERFARATGQAFQLRDDLSDLFAAPMNSGKRVGDDIRSAKPTELLGSALRLAGAADRATLIGIVGDPDASADEIDTVKTVFVESGAVAAITARIGVLVAEARRALAELRDDTVGAAVRSALEDLLQECTELSFMAP